MPHMRHRIDRVESQRLKNSRKRLSASCANGGRETKSRERTLTQVSLILHHEAVRGMWYGGTGLADSEGDDR